MSKAEEKARKEYFSWVDEIREKFKDMKPAEIERIINEAVRWARKQPKDKSAIVAKFATVQKKASARRI